MATLNFGPEWLRNLTDSGSVVSGASPVAASPSAPSFAAGACGLAYSSSPATRYKLAEHRYGREEMLALYEEVSETPAELKEISFIQTPKAQLPLALLPMSAEEQSLLLQCVNSVPMTRSAGRGSTSMRGGRGETDRGRGRGIKIKELRHNVLGRGRDEDGPLGKMRNRDCWDDRGGRQAYDRGYSAHSAEEPFTRDLNRSVSTESWRENKQHLDDDDSDSRRQDRDRWFDVSKDRYGPKNWREPRDHGERHEFDDFRQSRTPTETARKIEFKRSRSSGSTSFDEEALQNALPEWSTTNPQEVESIGTFDSSGAFLAAKENTVEKSISDAVRPVVTKDSSLKLSSVPELDQDAGVDMSRLPSNEVMDRAARDRISQNASSSSASSFSSEASSHTMPASSAQQLLIDNVNKLTVDGTVCDKMTASQQQGYAAALQNNFGITTASGLPEVTHSRTALPSGGIGLSKDHAVMPMPNIGHDFTKTETDVADFVIKWSADEDWKMKGKVQSSDLRVPESSEDRWFYRDPQGDIQGPFAREEMNEWLKTGYFTMNLLVRCGYEGDFCRLGDMIKTLGHVPFEPRQGTSLFNTAFLPLGPSVAALSQQQQQQLQKQQMEEQFRKQLLVLQQQQQQGILPPDYLRHLQLQGMLQQQQQLQLQHQQLLPQFCVPDGFGLIMPHHEALLGATPQTRPQGMHPASLASSSELFANRLPTALPLQTSTTNSGINTATSVPPKTSANSQMPKTVEQIEKLQFLELRKEAAAQMEEQHQRERERLEEKKRLEERKLLELQQKKTEEERFRNEEIRKVELQRRHLEEERRQLEELQKKVEQDRLMIEQQKQAEKIENEKRLKETVEERERLRLARIEEERARLEQKKQEELRRKEAEAAKKKQAEFEAKQKAETEAKQKREAEEKRKAEAEEAKKKQQAQASQLPAKSPWSLNGKATKESNSSMTLSQIQEAEKIELAEERIRQKEQQKAAAAAAAVAATEQSKQLGSWTAQRSQPSGKWIPSLLEIQQEQAKQLSQTSQQERTQPSPQMVNEATFRASPLWTASAPAPAPQWSKGGGWQTVEPAGKKKAAVLENSSHFPALGATASSHPTKTMMSASAKSGKIVAKTKKEEADVLKLFEVTKVRDELTEWCEKVLNGLQTSVDIPTLVDLLRDVETPQEVMDYIRMYLGESKQVRDFAQQFLEKRGRVKVPAKPKAEENVWRPAANTQQLSANSVAVGKTQPQQQKPTVPSSQKGTTQDNSDKGKGKGKKKKMQKVDNSILGFTVHADPNRVNVGQIDSV